MYFMGRGRLKRVIFSWNTKIILESTEGQSRLGEEVEYASSSASAACWENVE